MKKYIINLSERIAQAHERFFSYLAKRSKTSIWFTFLLVFMAFYEIVEHFIIPVLVLWWGLK
jgi:hypothetical protein